MVSSVLSGVELICTLLLARYQEELPTLISSRSEKYVTQSELVKLMEWKLTVSSTRDLNEADHSVTAVTLPGREPLLSRWETLFFFPQRGKFRPRLQQMVASNGEEVVQRCSRKAFALLPDVRAAIAELSSLKAVGPATASGTRSMVWCVSYFRLITHCPPEVIGRGTPGSVNALIGVLLGAQLRGCGLSPLCLSVF